MFVKYFWFCAEAAIFVAFKKTNNYEENPINVFDPWSGSKHVWAGGS